MQKNQAIFIIGSPGSGKDVIIRDITSNYNIVEFASYQIDDMLSEDSSFKRAKLEKRNSLLERYSIIITANSFDLGFVQTKSILESVGYTTHIILVEADLATSYSRLSNRTNLKESLDRISIGNNNKCAILDLFESKIVVDNSKTLDLDESRLFISNILNELSFKSDLTLEKILKIKPKVVSKIEGPATVVLPIIDDYQPKKKKLSSKVPDTDTDAVGDQCVAGMTGALGESISEPDVSGYGYTVTASGPMQNTDSSKVYQGSDQDKNDMNKRFNSLKKKWKNLNIIQPRLMDTG